MSAFSIPKIIVINITSHIIMSWEVERMKDNIKIGILILIGVFIVLFVWLKLIDLAYTDENDKIILVAAIGLIGAILGGVFSGAITLVGVKMTIENQERKEMKKTIISAKYLFIEFLPIINDINIIVMSMNGLNFMETRQKLKLPASKLISLAQSSYALSVEIDLDFYKNIKSIEYHSKELLVLVNPNVSKGSDQDIIREILIIRNNLAKCDNKFDELIRNISKS